MVRRPVLLVAAVALAAGALTSGTAHADDGTCVDTTEAPFSGSYVCVARGTVGIGYTAVPYIVGASCVGTVCTPALSGTLNVPTSIGDPADVYGQVCYSVGLIYQCRTFSDDQILAAISIGHL
jgi:hypothetical protein